LLPTPRDAGEPVAGLEGRKVSEELEGVVAPPLANRSERGQDALRLLIGQAARADDLDQLLERRPLHRVPVGRSAIRQARPAPASPGVVALRRQAGGGGRPESLARPLGGAL